MKGITTKAAKCPSCSGYHLIGAIESFNTDKATQKRYAAYMRKGYAIIDVTTKQARENFATHKADCP